MYHRCARKPDSRGIGHADAHGGADGNRNLDAYAHGYRRSNADTHGGANAHVDCQSDSDQHGNRGLPNAYPNASADRDGNTHSHTHGYGDRDAHGHLGTDMHAHRNAHNRRYAHTDQDVESDPYKYAGRDNDDADRHADDRSRPDRDHHSA